MRPLAQEAAQVLIARAMAQPLLCTPCFRDGFPKHPLLLLGETNVEWSYLDSSPLVFMLKQFLKIQFRK